MNPQERSNSLTFPVSLRRPLICRGFWKKSLRAGSEVRGTRPDAPLNGSCALGNVCPPRSPIQFAEFVFCSFESLLAPPRKLLPGAVQIKGEHRHSRPKRIALPPTATVSRPLKRACNSSRTILGEEPRFQIKSIAGFGYALRPAFTFIDSRHTPRHL